MSSVQVLPNPDAASSRKQGHLEAGKRRLEEFRKKKASRKVSSAGQINGIDNIAENDAAPTGNPPLLSTKDDRREMDKSFCPAELTNGSFQGGPSIVIGSQKVDQTVVNIKSDLDPFAVSSMDDDNVVINSKYHFQSNGNSNGLGNVDNYSRHLSLSHASGSMGLIKDARSVKQVPGEDTALGLTYHNGNDDPSEPNKSDQEGRADNKRGKIIESINRRLNLERPVVTEYLSVDHALDFKGSSTQLSVHSRPQGNANGRSRPSFLDSINISYVPSALALPPSSVEVDPMVSSNVPHGEVQLMSTEQSSMKIDNEENHVNHLIKNANDDWGTSTKKDDDFAALEQHIEDLTREKFSLLRELETSQTLAGSLASENASLTESFNQQGKVVSQLKLDIERLQDEIKAQMLAFQSLKLEYTNVQLECSAADERAKMLASEVINLEEKALRLRSNELKLEKHLENSDTEIISYKRKVSSLEKERKDFESTIEALQEEKKLLQTKLRKASIPEKVKDVKDRGNDIVRKDACTSTDDLGGREETHNAEISIQRSPFEDQGSTDLLVDNASTSSFHTVILNNVHPITVGTLPHDHVRMINNINSLLSELMLEQEALRQALASESSMSSKLKDLNRELSLKLEAQTQRLELLAAQKTAIDSVPVRRVNSGRTSEAIIEFADEGDEVVERVLGWIMKLFPGGPGKRRASRLF